MLFLRTFQAILLPPLAFVAPEIVNIKSPVRLACGVKLALEFDQAFAGRMNRKAPEVRHDPASPQTFCHRARRAAAAEEIRDEVAFVAAGADDAFEDGFGFLGGVVCAFVRNGIDGWNIIPNRINNVSWNIIEVDDSATACRWIYIVPVATSVFVRFKTCDVFRFVRLVLGIPSPRLAFSIRKNAVVLLWKLPRRFSFEREISPRDFIQKIILPKNVVEDATEEVAHSPVAMHVDASLFR